MLVVGSVAMQYHELTERSPMDMDIIGSYEEYEQYVKVIHENHKISANYPLSEKKIVIKFEGGIVEWEVAWPGSVAEELISIVGHGVASPETLLTLKLSHRYLKNNPHFLKTMKDIHTLIDAGYEVPKELKEWLVKREKETYNYKHPSLKRNKGEFFDGDGVDYKYDHDTLHLAVARGEKPAYQYFKDPDKEVWCSKELWDECDEQIKLNAVLEEAYVLALERFMVPNDFQVSWGDGFKIALEKICTSITSGWFREYAWENYYRILGIFIDTNSLSDNYCIHFSNALAKGVVKPYDPKTAY